MKIILTTVVLMFSLGSSALADSIYLTPGQCILIGKQQVCALKMGDDLASRNKVIGTCRWSDNPGQAAGKGYNLYLVTVKEDGSKSDTHIKSYGSLKDDKASCEKDAAEHQRLFNK